MTNHIVISKIFFTSAKKQCLSLWEWHHPHWECMLLTEIGVSSHKCTWLATIHAFAPFAFCMEWPPFWISSRKLFTIFKNQFNALQEAFPHLLSQSALYIHLSFNILLMFSCLSLKSPNRDYVRFPSTTLAFSNVSDKSFVKWMDKLMLPSGWSKCTFQFTWDSLFLTCYLP